MKQRVFLQLLYYVGLHKGRFFLAIISSMFTALCNILPEVFASLAIDVIVQKDQSVVAAFFNTSDVISQLLIIAILTIVGCILESFFEYCHLVLWKGFGEQVQHDLRVNMYSHISRLDMVYHETQTTGSILSLLNDDINELDRLLKETVNRFIQLLVTTCCIWTIFFYVAPKIALLSLVPIPFVLVVSFYFQRKLAPLYLKARDHASDLNGHIATTLMGIAEVKSYTAEEYELEQVKDNAREYKDLNAQATILSSAYIPLVRLIIMIGFVMTLVVGGLYVIQGKMEVAAYSMVVFLMQKFLWPFAEIAEIADVYEKAKASASRLFALLGQESETQSGNRELPATTVEGSVRFENVGFEYESQRPILHNITCEIQPGKMAAFVGASDSGKSTLSKLLLRFYDVSSGSIFIDGIDVRTLNLQDLRRAIALVSHDVYLFQGSLADNIVYGSFDASREDVMHAAQLADLHEFIMSLPNRYDTIISERGQKLSSSQRQKIALARSILKNAAIVIFDQATFSLDNETDVLLQHWLQRPQLHHTMIIITHRLITACKADIIFVLDKGAIVESGTHDELLAKDGVYAGLWRAQTSVAH